jgi:hypothetical protein
MRTFDSKYSDWKVGDKVVWEEKRNICPLFTIKEIDMCTGRVSWERPEGTNSADCGWLLRVIETERDKTDMTDLEKLITALCELPPTTLEGNSDISVHYATRNPDQPFVLLEDVYGDSLYLDPSQTLALLDWLKKQRENLEELQEALRAKHIEDEALSKQREAERIIALKALHSEAVTAWQDGGCTGPRPTLKDIVFKEQFVRVDLFEESANPVTFVKQYPMLERLRRGKEG